MTRAFTEIGCGLSVEMDAKSHCGIRVLRIKKEPSRLFFSLKHGLLANDFF